MSIIELNAHKFVALCVRHIYHTEGNYYITESNANNFAKKYTKFYNNANGTQHTFEFKDEELTEEFVKNYLCADPDETLVPSKATKFKIGHIIDNLPKEEKHL